MTDVETGTPGQDGLTRRTEKAKEIVGQAGHALKAEAQSFASAAQDRVRAEAQKGAQVGARTLGDFANAVRRAGDELSQSDQSPASHLVRQAADGLESLSRNLADKEPGDLLNSVRDFGRRNPAAFIGGAVLVGLALGRFARASEAPAAPAPDLGDEDLSFTESYEAAPVLRTGTLDAAIAEDLGDLQSDGTVSSDPTVSPPIGDR
ncbi:MAG: hypothetical protein KKE02_14205 [Alphaproteobacteria bacterium]|nr:hypothetical protein [Alphaproteobacteria bacterium]MBU1513144.1 hypothetical protein [Alphaproteobacteria bacterium]MBU2095252.1 hypothetical protein [Alphaproteobacteria bacterium]MBU2152167.1 hypothetical protein [Alphaproteobacteria bacterium]MBU2306786.1 hypothetical protein [Alphaproteobacteria bacterium]